MNIEKIDDGSFVVNSEEGFKVVFDHEVEHKNNNMMVVNFISHDNGETWEADKTLKEITDAYPFVIGKSDLLNSVGLNGIFHCVTINNQCAVFDSTSYTLGGNGDNTIKQLIVYRMWISDDKVVCEAGQKDY